MRSFTLPLLWSVIEITSVNALGKLRDALRLMPQLATSVQHFRLSWTLRDGDRCEPYPKSCGSTLDVAFIDRGALWDCLREFCGSEMQGRLKGSYFLHKDNAYVQPGEPAPLDHDAKCAGYEDWSKACCEAYSTPRININRSGPDGLGEDPRIKSAEDFYACIAEVVSQLPSLRSFSWDSGTAPPPASVFEALQKLPTLQQLHLTFWYSRNISILERTRLEQILTQGEWITAGTSASDIAKPPILLPQSHSGNLHRSLSAFTSTDQAATTT